VRVLFDIVHPAHVHFFKYLRGDLVVEGHETLVVAREKYVTLALLDEYDIPYESVGQSGRKDRVGQARELINRDLTLYRLARKFRPNLILTRNPAGVHVAKVLRGAVGVFDTDDGRAAGIHFRTAAPFADVITTPDCMGGEDYGRKHRKYASYKALAYLHPDRFTPDSKIRGVLGVGDEPYAIVRFVDMVASHDRDESGMSLDDKRHVIEQLTAHGRVFVSCEGAMPDEFAELRFSVPAHLLHDALAQAWVCVGDSQTMAAEAAILGVPAIRCSSFVGRLAYLEELEHKYELIESFLPADAPRLLERIEDLRPSAELAQTWRERQATMLADKIDLTSWYRALCAELTG
jgi:predicted glycosyltransferase